MKVAVVGTGRMGQAIAWAIDKLHTQGQWCDLETLTLVDTSIDNLKECSEQLDCSVLAVHSSDGNADSTLQTFARSFLEGQDVVISALPYHQNTKLAAHCIHAKIPYCDLGGHIGTSNTINDYAESTGAVVMTDLGLAPGWVNILADTGYRLCRTTHSIPTTVEMMVGGLPIDPRNYLKYGCTWSYDGLINEYKDQCEVLVNGFNTLAAGMSGLVDIETSLGTMEAFYTSGGAAHTIQDMQKRGVQNCHYKTIRYKGHCEAMKFLMYECGLSDEDLSELLKHACPPADDLVIIHARVDDWLEEKIIMSNKRFSAMQMSTAFPIAVASTMIAHNCEHGGGPLSYQDFSHTSYREFELNLDFLFKKAEQKQ